MKSNSSQYTIEGLIPGPSAFCFLSQNVISTHDQFSDMVVTSLFLSRLLQKHFVDQLKCQIFIRL